MESLNKESATDLGTSQQENETREIETIGEEGMS